MIQVWTPVPTSTLTPTSTFTPTMTHTPTFTNTPSPTSTPTFTLTATLTWTYTPTPTLTPTVSIVVFPSEREIPVGQSRRFFAQVNGTSNHEVIWRVNGVEDGSAETGFITETGLYTAPGNLIHFRKVIVEAVSQQDAAGRAKVEVTLSPAFGVWILNGDGSVSIRSGE